MDYAFRKSNERIINPIIHLIFIGISVVEDSINDNLKLCECGYCNELINKKDKYGRPRRFKQSHVNRGVNNASWKGGMKKHGGYIQLLNHEHPNSDINGYVLAHRVIYEHYLKILFDEDVYIPKGYDVHHINGIRNDNSLMNLQLISTNEHTRLHNNNRTYIKKDMSGRFCLLCDSKTTSIRKDKNMSVWFRYENGFICRKCYRKQSK